MWTVSMWTKAGSSERLYLVNSALHEVKQHLHRLHVFPTVIVHTSLDGHIKQDIQAGHGQVVQQVDGMTGDIKTTELCF